MSKTKNKLKVVWLYRHKLYRHLYIQYCLQLKKIQPYRDKMYSRTSINQMWILKNSKKLLDIFILVLFFLSKISSLQSFDFSTLYNTIPNEKWKIPLKENIVLKMVGNVASYTENEIISILEFFIDNIFVEIGQLDCLANHRYS